MVSTTSLSFHLLIHSSCCCLFSFFFNDTAPPVIYTLSLHDALPISRTVKVAYPHLFGSSLRIHLGIVVAVAVAVGVSILLNRTRSEEHTSELQSRGHLVCRLLLEKKKYFAYEILFRVRGKLVPIQID